MESFQPSRPVNSFWKSGLITALVTMALYLLFYYTGAFFLVWKIIPLYLVPISLILTGVILQGKKWGDRASFGQLFLEGLKASAVFAAVHFLLMILFLALVPAFPDAILAHYRTRGDLDPMGNAASTYRRFKFIILPVLLFLTLLRSFFQGLFGALVGAAVARKTISPMHKT